MSDSYTEGEHRLHAVVRAAISPGIWLALGAQMLVLLLSRGQATVEPNSGITLTGVFAALAILLFLYVQAGAFAALALGRDRISVLDVIQRGKEVFTDFMWLAIKASLLLAAVLSILVYVLAPGEEQDVKVWVEQFSPFLAPLTAIFGFIFVYWLPIVFVKRDFHLLPTWRAALQIAGRRLWHSGYLAFLTLAPSLLPEFLPAMPTTLILFLSVLGGWMGWVAYIYCVEVLRDDPKVMAPAAAV